ncbi:MAG: MogA/MoaB family molybdenum cofactor biosynthesis protein [Thermotogaceae bacterium]|nr:MogA/MoaB family molybdenum cofactor biosynthesis protein [Thermotogaceae bacterium]
MIKAAILTISDKGSKGERKDESGEMIKVLLENIGAEISYYKIVPDEFDIIREELLFLSNSNYDLVVTSGGTGISPRDVTPEATLSVIEKRLHGMENAMLIESIKHTPLGMLSRSVVGIKGKTLIVNLPGSPRAVKENLVAVLVAVPHALEKIRGSQSDCAEQRDRLSEWGNRCEQ